MPIRDLEHYRRIEADLGNPEKVARAGSAVGKAKADMASFRGSNPHLFTGTEAQDFRAASGLDFSAAPEAPKSRSALELPTEADDAAARAPLPERPRFTNSASFQAGMARAQANPDEFSQELFDERMARAEEERRQADLAKKFSGEAYDKALPNASKLKVFSEPPEYFPPTLGSELASSLTATRYFEPTGDEFRDVALSVPGIGQRVGSAYPERKLEELTDQELEATDAFAAYADARWQKALAQSVKSRVPIVRQAYSKRSDDAGGKVAGVMDPVMALGTGMLQGASAGGYDLALSGAVPPTKSLDARGIPQEDEPGPPGAARELRDAGRGSMERNPTAGTVGEFIGALHPRSIGSKVTGGIAHLIGKLPAIGKASGLTATTAKSAASGAASAVLDENMRAAALHAANALDARDTASEAAARIARNLPGLDAGTAMLGGGVGAAGNLLGAGAGAAERGIRNMRNLKVPLQRAEAEGVKLGPLGGTKVSPQAQEVADRATQVGTTAEDIVAEDIAKPTLRQMLKDQEASTRQAELDTSIAQANLEGVNVPTREAVDEVLGVAASMKPITPHERRLKKRLGEIASELADRNAVSADELDDILAQLDAEANIAGGRGEPVGKLVEVRRAVSGLRDRLAGADEQTIADKPPIIRSYREAAENTRAALGDGDGALRRYSEISLGMNGNLLKRGQPGISARPDADTMASELSAELARARAAGGGYDGVVYRGIRLGQQDLKRFSGTEVDIPSFSSTSVKPEVARDFSTRGPKQYTPVVMKIHQQGGVAVGNAAVPGVEEVLLEPGNFKILERRMNGDTLELTLQRTGSENATGKPLQPVEDRGLFTATPDDTLVDAVPQTVVGMRDARGDVKAVRGYSALKSAQHRDMKFREFDNAQMGLPPKLKARDVETEFTDKGLFNPKTPDEVVSEIEPDVELTADQDRAFKQNIKGLRRSDDSAMQSKLRARIKAAGIDFDKAAQTIKELEAADRLENALGRSISGVSLRGGNVGSSVRMEQLLRAVPTLRSMSGGLPSKGLPDIVASPGAVKRLNEFLELMNPKMDGDFIPTTRALSLRGGQPARAIGAFRDEKPQAAPQFSEEEARFWVDVINNLTESK